MKNVYTKCPDRKLSGFVEISCFMMTLAHSFSNPKFGHVSGDGTQNKENGGCTAVVSTCSQFYSINPSLMNLLMHRLMSFTVLLS